MRPEPSAAATEGRPSSRAAAALAPAPGSGSWFGALSDDAPPRAPGGRDEPQPDTSGVDAVADAAGPTSAQRIYRTFLAARAALGVALLLAQGVPLALSIRPPALLVALSGAYAVLALAMWWWPGLGRLGGRERDGSLSLRQGLTTIGVDLLLFGAMYLGSDNASFNHAALLVLPVLMAGILTPRNVGLGTALLATALLLLKASLAPPPAADWVGLISQAGLAGIGFLILALLMNQLALRLAREARAARGSLEVARQQAQLNRLVIEEMEEGVMVVDRRGWVRATNPSARSLLGVDAVLEDASRRSGGFQLQGVEAWGGLVDAMETAFAQGGQWPAAGRAVALQFDSGQRRQVQLRMRFTRRRGLQHSEDVCVLFLEDLRELQARQRQDKLAAMGRVSAGIAHEIRNPLAAIAQANALLAEDAVNPAQRKLTSMVADNVERLKRIVDDVMEVAPGDTLNAPWIELGAEVATICTDWARTAGLPAGADSALRVDLPPGAAPMEARFDPHHLRRVLVNLLDNAHRHGTATPAATCVRLVEAEGLASLSVLSDGAPIDAEVERFLFEPFFSTRSRGSGLGLYICRELCERHHAEIDYRSWPEGARYRNEFRVRFPLAAPAAESSFAPLT